METVNKRKLLISRLIKYALMPILGIVGIVLFTQENIISYIIGGLFIALVMLLMITDTIWDYDSQLKQDYYIRKLFEDEINKRG